VYHPINGVGSVDNIFNSINGVVQTTLQEKLFNVVVLGIPGSGKGTQSARLAEEFGLKYISTGKLLRKEIAEKTEFGNKAQGYMKKGDIVPDELAIQIIEREIKANPNAKGFIFKGFPRSIVQAYILDGILQKTGTSVSLVIDLDISMLEAFRRLYDRRKTDNSRMYDANPETIIHRIEEYENISAKVPKYYEKKKRVAVVDGNGNTEDVYQRLRETIEAEIKRLR